MSARARSSSPTQGRAPGVLLQLMEVRAFWEHYACIAMRPFWRVAPSGDGHPVLVLPGLAAGDATTALCGASCGRAGFRPVGLGTGAQSRAQSGRIGARARALRELYGAHGRAVSVIGWSLGGLYARELAKHSPEMVRLCITLGSPFTGHPRETNAWRLYEFASGHRIDWHDFHGPLRAAPPVPTTSIWSASDGIVAWRCSVETRRIWRKTSSSVRATSASGRIRRRSMRSLTASPSRRANGSLSIAAAGGASSIAIQKRHAGEARGA